MIFKTFLNSDDYNINISSNSLYLNNYKSINGISDNLIIVIFNDFKLRVYGTNFKLNKMMNNELYISGMVKGLEIYDESM